MSIKKIADFPEDKNPKGGTRKLKDIPFGCQDKEHNPPMYQYFEPGVYEHECPTCGKKKIFTVPRITMSTNDPIYDDESPSYIRGNEDGI
jgi:hypothetical protein